MEMNRKTETSEIVMIKTYFREMLAVNYNTLARLI